MYFMHYTFEDIRKCTVDQLNFLAEGVKKVKELEAKAAKKAGSKSRRRKR